MKKYTIALFVALLMLAPVVPVHAVTSTETAKLQLIATLLEQIKILQAKLAALQLKQATGAVKTEYQVKVEPLLEELEEVEEDIDFLEEKIEQKECNTPKWTYVDGKRTFRCTDDEDADPKESQEIDDLKEELSELEEEKEDLENKIDNLKTRYGV